MSKINLVNLANLEILSHVVMKTEPVILTGIKGKNGETHYKEATITIFEGSIHARMDYFMKLSNDPTVTVDEAIVSVGSHENTHDTDQASINGSRITRRAEQIH